MKRAQEPPRLARRLLERALPADSRDDIAGDVEEVFRLRRQEHGAARARLWYWRQAISFAVRFTWERLRERRRPDRRGLIAARVSWLDIKLGLRMLVKYPGLALVGGLAIAVAIAIGAMFAATAEVYHATLPLDEGERVVALEAWDTEVSNQERQILHDFVTWQEELESVEDLGAYRNTTRNLIVPGGTAEPIRVAEMTASGFELARVPPLLGRPLVEADEREGAAAVVVIGHDAWRTRFGYDPAVVGREVRLGNTIHTVVGVMPEGFRFPVFHRVWVPFRADPSDYERRDGPEIYVFGRLAPGATLDGARAELTTLGQRAAAAFPQTHERLRPRLMPYTLQFYDDDEGLALRAVRIVVVLLLVVICVNVAILVYARTATRRGEIAVRSALGASRRRVVGQLFVEAFVLSLGAALVGLAIAGVILRQVDILIERLIFAPFWVDFGLSAGTVMNVIGLAALAAVIVGVLPALKATGRRLRSGLQGIQQGAADMRLGRTWTVLIVAQVAFAVAVLPPAVAVGSQFLRYAFADPGFAADEFLTATLTMERDVPPSAEADAYQRTFDSRYGTRLAELVRRLQAEPALSAVTYSMEAPGNEYRVWIEVEGLAMPGEGTTDTLAVRQGSAGHAVGIGRVDVDYFDTFEVPSLTGRLFGPRDARESATAVIVNRSFVQRILNGGNALGRRIRYVGRGGDVSSEDVELDRWYEIVGVVPDFPKRTELGRLNAKVYHPMEPGSVYPVTLSMRVRSGVAAGFAPGLREVAATLDPTLQLHEVLSLDAVLREEQVIMRLSALGIALVTLSVLLLSAAGIHALMSFTVAQRRREIGIRAALGAHPRRLLQNIFSRAVAQLTLGVVVGTGLMALLDSATDGEMTDGRGAIMLLGVAAFMMAVGIIATIGPARRGLRIQPTEALKET
ncbi:MAG: ABC transporter permease [Longimicrobiales bacterium]